ncbi:hypothetical protein NEOLEDRAFT_1058906, partial [Neolentinus lepideus HHB14362 ss-1]
SPLQPRVAVSINLLEFYSKLFYRSGDAVSSAAAALNDFYISRGYRLIDEKGLPIADPFRRGLSHAMQWYDCLRVLHGKEVSQIIEGARVLLPNPPLVSPPGCPTAAPSNTEEPTLHRARCAAVLRDRCPACFGEILYGRSFGTGSDLHVAIDLNFHQRHRRTAGDSPKFYAAEYFISKEDVDAVGERILKARKKGPRSDYRAKVPDIAVDECEKSFEAADEAKQKTHEGRFDDTGLVALICRHDNPILLANVDTPGEQQKFAVALLEALFLSIPTYATVCCLYDVGCVIDRSLHLYDILSPDVVSRLMFATSAMHAYGHQWSCQLVYNPRLRHGLGLTDGEGVERLWSRLRKLISVTRSSGRQRRIWLLDRQAHHINDINKQELGHWIRRKLMTGVVRHAAKASTDLQECGYSIDVLRKQWELQKEAQGSLRSHAPARLKKELDAVLALQTQAELVKNAIDSTEAVLASGKAPPNTTHSLSAMHTTHCLLIHQIETLYASLNVSESFPELHGLNVEFVRILLVARDLKINIRKRAMGCFFEWNRIDQAVGGREQALGTKLHQKARKSLTRRRPALLTAINKFNTYCTKLRELAGPHPPFPLPTPLSLNLGHLKLDDNLMQDVWIDTREGECPLWLTDPAIRKGIRAFLQIDRCLEERRCLGREAENLLRWFAEELAALEIAVHLTEGKLSEYLSYSYITAELP